MWNSKLRSDLVFSIEKQMQRPRILIISLLQRNNKSAQYPHVLPPPPDKVSYMVSWIYFQRKFSFLQMIYFL